MKRLTWWILGVFVLISPHALLAQRRGGHGGGASQETTGTPKTDDFKDFRRAVALQATPDQIAQFRRSSASTQLAQKRAQDLLQLSAAGAQPDLFHHADILADAVEEARADNEKFLLSFSKEQQEALKKFAKKLRKSDSEVTNQTKALSQGFEQRGLTDKQISAILEKLDKALGEFQSEQLAIGSEMGIQGHGNLSN